MSPKIRFRGKTRSYLWMIAPCVLTLNGCMGKTTEWEGDFPSEAMIITPEEFKTLEGQGSVRAVAPADYVHYGSPVGEISTGLTFAPDRPVMAAAEAQGRSELARARASSVDNQKLVLDLLASTVSSQLKFILPVKLDALESKTPKELSALAATLARFNRSLGKTGLIHPLLIEKVQKTPTSSFSVDCTGDEDSAVTWQADVSSSASYATSLPKGLIRNFDFPLKKKVTCVKDQGSRGTCEAFAMTGALEAEIAVQQGRFVNLSEQDLYSHIRNIWAPDDVSDGAPTAETWRIYAGSSYFQPKESIWSYNRSKYRHAQAKDGKDIGPFEHSCDAYPGLDCSKFEGNEYGHCLQKVKLFGDHCSDTSHQARFKCAAGVLDWQGNPHRICGYAGPLRNGDGFRINGEAEIWDTDSKSESVDRLVAMLEAGKPTVLSVKVPPSFDNPDPSGYVVYLDDKETSRGDHAILAIGYVSNAELAARLGSYAPAAAGDGYVIVKNSWGPSFGDRGYVYLPTKWLESYANSAVVLTGKIESETK